MAAPPTVNVNAASVLASGKQQQIETAGGDKVIITPLGSGGEVGRSCILCTFRGRTIMFDCGIHPVKSGLDALPLFDAAPLQDVDTCLVTHFHLDHCGGLPYLCEQTGFRGRVIMTRPTKSFYRMVMLDFLRIGAGANDIVNPEWLNATIERIETVEYHQEFVHNGVRAVALNAGHVLGAAMFLVDMGGVRILYTGDYSRVPDRHLLGAELPPVSPDILIVESTYGIQIHETREERERKFTGWVHDIVKRGGRCLIPVFALGRAQELLLILEEYWAENKDIQHVPVYYASSLATRCMNLYRTYGGAMNDRVRQQLDNHTNPFDFKFILPLKDLASFDDNGPSVVLASPGMLQSGVSLELFERWAGDRKNGLIFAGYCADGTLAKQVMRKPKEVVRDDGSALQVRMQDINVVSFSAHSDARQTCDFISQLKDTRYAVLVHGNEDSGNKLQKKLTDDFAARGMQAFATRNAVPVEIPFAVQRTATLIGAVAHEGAALREDAFAAGERRGLEAGAVTSSGAVEGVLLVGADQQCTVVAPNELRDYSGLALAAVKHATIVPLATFLPAGDVLRELKAYFARSSLIAAGTINPTMAGTKKARGEAPPPAAAESSGDDGDAADADDDEGEDEVPKIDVGASVVVAVGQGSGSRTTLTVTWNASDFADLVADVAIVALVALSERSAHGRGGSLGGDALAHSATDLAFRLKCFQRMLAQHFSSVRVNLATGDALLSVPTVAEAGAPTRWVHVANWVQASVLPEGPAADDPGNADLAASEPLQTSGAIAPDVQAQVSALLRRAFFGLNPIPADEPTGVPEHDAVAAYLDRGGWCECGEHGGG
eukprot:CAMPEP_0174876226 /NCGR_PEP_ID=MMETSP1114-20130205/79757_1 /TAXON_ID=312471 /ORGANISM="Neobodo designis, Strain CCAP 1951/1" /LENGTH=832 /DNA_ID=CAMNT_0016111595 /DNA_START=50 /DNA_END=2544 /DNA_ORIENTATION=-